MGLSLDSPHYKDTYIHDLKKIIQAKAKGKKLKALPVPAETTKLTNMMSLLKQSLVKKTKSRRAKHG